jgi:hypothetical protein
MEPLQILKDFSKQNPQAAGLLYGAVACFAAVAAISSFGDLESRIPSVLYVIAIGVVLAITTAILTDKLMMAVLKWFVVLIVIAWTISFIIYHFNPTSQTLACVVRFWEPCRDTADKVADQTAPTKITPANPPTISPTASFQPSNYQVFVQFAGSIRRDDVKAMMKILRDSGWNVQGVDGGGERTTAAAGLAEVRYSTPEDALAAKALAQAVQATNLISRSIAVKSSSGVAKGTLEVWISR